MLFRLLTITLLTAITAFSQTSQSGPPIEPGVSQALAQWRAARYSDVRYKLNLTLEKMSPVLKGTIEIRVKVGESGSRGVGETATLGSEPGAVATGFPIVLDWRKIRGSESLSTISNVTLNGNLVKSSWTRLVIGPGLQRPPSGSATQVATPTPQDMTPSPSPSVYRDGGDHLVFDEGVVAGENVIKLDFTSPILTSGSAITRYVDKEDGAEYIYSLFVPSDASTAFPVFDQPDLKAKFQLNVSVPTKWKVISNSAEEDYHGMYPAPIIGSTEIVREAFYFEETKPISTYVFAFAAGDFTEIRGESSKADMAHPIDIKRDGLANRGMPLSRGGVGTIIYVRKSQAAKFKPHAGEVFRLNREGIKYLESYFDYKFPFPKYDLVLIPEFPFGGMEHAGATFLREASIIFPTEPTKSDHISRANLTFHEAAHQWFGDTVTMRWFDDLWLKEGFAEFMAYKTLEKVMPEANAWKVFYERNKQAAYLTDSTKGTTPIYQKIDNLSAAKSAYGNIVYRKAPSFLRQAEFYLGEQKFQTAARAFLKKHEYANAGWEDLVKEFETASKQDLKEWARQWVQLAGLPKFQVVTEHDTRGIGHFATILLDQSNAPQPQPRWNENLRFYVRRVIGRKDEVRTFDALMPGANIGQFRYRLGVGANEELFVFPNYGDYGYGIFLLDNDSQDYILKNIQNEKDPFLRSMMWGSLWDSVREAELDPRVYVELVIKSLPTEQDETIVSSILGRVSTAMNYYMSDAVGSM
ncbi:MAG: M1 family aminopeptidase, partial [Pyrinomonadaceae bacterium]